jgi:hypothetical protein
MMEAVRTSETSVDNHSTRQYNPEDSSEHHTRRRENLRNLTVHSNIVINYVCTSWLQLTVNTMFRLHAWNVCRYHTENNAITFTLLPIAFKEIY